MEKKRRKWEGAETELTNGDLNLIRTGSLTVLELLRKPSDPRSIPKQLKLQFYIWMTEIEDAPEYKAFCKLADEQFKEFFEDWKEVIKESRQLDDKELEEFVTRNERLFNAYLQTRLSDFAQAMVLEELSGINICKFILCEDNIPDDATPSDLRQAGKLFEYQLKEDDIKESKP